MNSPILHASGSSPLTRGKPGFLTIDEVRARLIPAHAGKTCSPPPPSRSTRAHPRSRGENHFRACELGPCAGSSPLTRGKLSVLKIDDAGARLIPAHAGKTITWVAQLITSWAHPRSRGENMQPATPEQIDAGSSPLTRGKLETFWLHSTTGRLIPAHAGKTSCLSAGARPGKAHPRSRGENFFLTVRSLSDPGSSPLTRGKRPHPLFRGLVSRLIPAHAGKTRAPERQGPAGPAHPRSRGENPPGTPQVFSDMGSSPLTRGKRSASRRPPRLRRLIPAHAGKTVRAGLRVGRQEAHPRSRGENSTSSRRPPTAKGSSPLTRGKPMIDSSANVQGGLIPAHAGKTT